MTTVDVPTAVHLGAAALPFVDIGDGSKLKVIMVEAARDLWIIENVFQSGYEVQRHKHTGPVYAYTTSGAWRYKEHPGGGRGRHACVVPDLRGEPQSRCNR